MTLILIILIASTFALLAEKDTLNFETNEVHVEDNRNTIGMDRMLPVQSSAIYAGKKTELIDLSKVNANLAGNPVRQVFAKISGLNVWEGDVGNMQISIGGRGLSPHRTSNFNVRQNGYDISADALGYPESYYTPPMEALDKIEIVRGAASLQYGTQFGGFINFRLKQAERNSPLEIVSRQSGGGFNNPIFGMGNTFNSAKFSTGKLSFYSYVHLKAGQGWRNHSEFNQVNGHFDMLWSISESSELRLEFTKMHYLAQQPGGIADNELSRAGSIAHRTRNWFNVDWNVLALVFDQKIGKNFHLNVRNFAVIAERSSLGILGRVNRPDLGGPRNLIEGNYANFGNETRLLYKYKLFNQPNALLTGVRLYRGSTEQIQGPADSSNGAVFEFISFEDKQFSDYSFPGWNTSFFAENMFSITDKLTITPGVRFETISTNAEGVYQNVSYGLLDGDVIENSAVLTSESRSNTRSFLLAGIGVSYYHSRSIELYTNFSQNYRAINFNDMRIVNPSQRIDLNLQDEKGWSYDFGFRGKYSDILDYDVNFFMLNYQDKIGDLPMKDTLTFIPYRYRTNISDAISYGMESFAEINIIKLFNKASSHDLNFFTNLSLINARYVDSDLPMIDGNNLELSPNLIFRTGFNYIHNKLRISSVFTYMTDQYTDATNAEFDPSAIYGVIPSYYVLDLNVSYDFDWLELSVGSENLTNNLYFTRRATGYPGPGIIPSDVRSFYINLNFKY